MKCLSTFILLLVGSFMAHGQSQLFIDNTYALDTMLNDFFGNGQITISNVVYTGPPQALAYFEAANTNMNTEAGIIFSSGDASQLANGVDFFSNTSLGTPGDADLSLAAGMPTYDATVLEMDIVSTADMLQFKYVFGSEEYPEYVCTSFNDIFAFWVSGPGIAEPVNIASIPGTTIPVSVNNINGVAPCNGAASNYIEYYVDNLTAMGTDVALDGFTTELPATMSIIPGETYHVKIAIADAGDGVFDSAVFLGIESLDGDSLLIPPANMNLVVNNAGNSVECYNLSRYATSYFWDFGDNTNSALRFPGTHQYAEPGEYTISLITFNYCCSDTVSATIQVGTTIGTTDLASVVSVSPNPMHNTLNITLPTALEATYSLTDITGRTQISGKQSGNQLILDTHSLPLGTYFLTLDTNQGRIVKRVVKE